MAPQTDRFKLPPRITGSSWSNVAQAVRRTARTEASGDDGVVAPVWSCREAAAIVAAWRTVARLTADGFPLWYQFAASAYGWDPAEGKLRQYDDQASALYPPEDAAALVSEIDRIAAARDQAQVVVPRDQPALALVDVWNDPQFLDDIKAAMAGDGAVVEWKIPIPACKDPKTGKPAKPVRNPTTGKWECPGGVVTIDDPLTAIIKSLSKIAPLAIVVGVLYLVDRMETPRHRRR